jgi:hypothetical protein
LTLKPVVRGRVRLRLGREGLQGCFVLRLQAVL